jgi:hypothetical protein
MAAASSSSPERRGEGRAAHGCRLVALCLPLFFLFLLLCVGSPVSEAFTLPAAGAGTFLVLRMRRKINET